MAFVKRHYRSFFPLTIIKKIIIKIKSANNGGCQTPI